MFGAVGQKQITLYSGILPRNWGLEIALLALSQHPGGMIKQSRILLFVSSKVKVRSGFVSDPALTHFRWFYMVRSTSITKNFGPLNFRPKNFGHMNFGQMLEKVLT